MFAIGDRRWPGISKLTEEAGEVCQVTGKLMGTKGDTSHWDGTDLARRLEEELGDLIAAAIFVVETCDEIDQGVVELRSQGKLELFKKWHREQANGD